MQYALFIWPLVLYTCWQTTLKKEEYSFNQQGKASYYANRLQGNRMAGGDIYHADSLVAAHRFLPFGTPILVTNQKNGKQVWLTVQDRGPFHHSRIVDVSGKAAEILDFRQLGIVEVLVEANLSPVVLDSLRQRKRIP